MGHTYAKILVHVIFSTKGRRRTIDEDIRQRLHEYLGGIARKEFGKAMQVGGTDDHLHALLSLRTDVAVADAMRMFKGLSSAWVHNNFPESSDFAWQEGYAAFTVSQSVAGDVIEYIVNQAEHIANGRSRRNSSSS